MPRPTRRAVVATVAGVVGVPVLTVLTLAVAGQLDPPRGGLLDPGPVTRWAVPALTALRDAASALTVGLLALAMLTMQTPENLDSDDLGPERAGIVRFASGTAAAWAAVGAALVVVTFSEVAGRPVASRGFWAGFGGFLVDVELGRLLAGGALMAAAVAIGTRFAQRLSTTVILALVAAGALLPVALSGHSAGEADHATAVNTVFAHLLGVSAWTGGLAGLVVLRVAWSHDITAIAHRFSTVAGACFALVTVSGVWRVLVRVEEPADLLGPYGAILGVKVVLLVALGVSGALHRRRTLRVLSADPRRWDGFVRLVVGELVVIGAAIALGAALSRTALP